MITTTSKEHNSTQQLMTFNPTKNNIGHTNSKRFKLTVHTLDSAQTIAGPQLQQADPHHSLGLTSSTHNHNNNKNHRQSSLVYQFQPNHNKPSANFRLHQQDDFNRMRERLFRLLSKVPIQVEPSSTSILHLRNSSDSSLPSTPSCSSSSSSSSCSPALFSTSGGSSSINGTALSKVIHGGPLLIKYYNERSVKEILELHFSSSLLKHNQLQSSPDEADPIINYHQIPAEHTQGACCSHSAMDGLHHQPDNYPSVVCYPSEESEYITQSSNFTNKMTNCEPQMSLDQQYQQQQIYRSQNYSPATESYAINESCHQPVGPLFWPEAPQTVAQISGSESFVTQETMNSCQDETSRSGELIFGVDQGLELQQRPTVIPRQTSARRYDDLQQEYQAQHLETDASSKGDKAKIEHTSYGATRHSTYSAAGYHLEHPMAGEASFASGQQPFESAPTDYVAPECYFGEPRYIEWPQQEPSQAPLVQVIQQPNEPLPPPQCNSDFYPNYSMATYKLPMDPQTLSGQQSTSICGDISSSVLVDASGASTSCNIVV